MDDAFFVGRFERLGDLRRQDYSVFEGNRTAGDAVGERLAVDELEDEHLLTIDLFQPVDRADVRVVQRRQHLRFAPEAREPFGSMGEAVRQRFQRDVTTQPCVPGPIDLTHTAFAQFRHDLIWTDGPPDHSRGLCWATARPRHSSRGARRSRAEAGPPVPSGDRISYGPRRAPRESVIWRAVIVIRLDQLARFFR